jgi:hypothetical protein
MNYTKHADMIDFNPTHNTKSFFKGGTDSKKMLWHAVMEFQMETSSVQAYNHGLLP